MLLSLFNVQVMGAMFIYMVSKAQFATARRMALIPLAVCAVEMLVFGLFSVELFPLLSAVLTVLRGVIALCCVAAMRRDARMVRQRERRLRREAAQKAAAPCTAVRRSVVRCA